MPKVRHLTTWLGSRNGTVTETFHEGEVDDLPRSLTDVATREGWAKPVGQKKAKRSREDRSDTTREDRARE